MGYETVYVAEAGYPAWVAEYGTGGASIDLGGDPDAGTIDVAQFNKIVKENPDSIVIVDVRDPDEFKAGHFPTAVNVPVDQLEKKLKSGDLPKDKPVVFVCATGARSGEAFWMAKDVAPDMEKCFFLDANVTYEDGKPVVKGPKK